MVRSGSGDLGRVSYLPNHLLPFAPSSEGALCLPVPSVPLEVEESVGRGGGLLPLFLNEEGFSTWVTGLALGSRVGDLGRSVGCLEEAEESVFPTGASASVTLAVVCNLT